MPPILVVADVEPRGRIAHILRQAGYTVAEADSEASTLATASSISPELILMAIVMSDSNGLEVAARLRQHLNSQSPPIILLGAIMPIGIDEEPLASLVSGYLDMDVSANELLVTVQSHIKRNQRLH